MAVSVDEFLKMLDHLPETKQGFGGDWVSIRVRNKGFGYLWERTSTVGLKTTLEEQAALVGERPEVFEIQFTTESTGWVVVHLDLIEADELFELVTEAWCMTAPKSLVDAHEIVPWPVLYPSH